MFVVHGLPHEPTDHERVIGWAVFVLPRGILWVFLKLNIWQEKSYKHVAMIITCN